MKTLVLVEGMTCQHCVRAVFTALAGVEGIARADVRLGSAEIEHDGSVTVEQIGSAVEVVGYRVRKVERAGRVLPVL